MNKIFYITAIIILMFNSNAFALYGYIPEKSTGHVISYFENKHKPDDTDDYSFTVCLPNDKPELYKPPVVPKFNPQQCEGDLYKTFLPTLSDADKAILAQNSSLLIITRCFQYNNDEAWATLKLHMDSLESQGLSSDAIESFKEIVKNNHYDLDKEVTDEL